MCNSCTIAPLNMMSMMCFVITSDTPSPQVGSPRVGSDINDSPHRVVDATEEGEGEKERAKEGEEGEGEEGEGEEEGKGEEGEEDPCTRSEGAVCFVVTDPTCMESRLSDPVVIRNVPW